MIYKELENIFKEEKSKGALNSYIRNLLKEYLQIYVLYFIYTSSDYNNNLIFTGGTCLRHFFGLERLSEDIDFDYIDNIEVRKFLDELEYFFRVRYKYKEIQTSIKQSGEQIVLKFPVLHKLGLADRSESNFLYIKIDLSKIPSSYYSLQTTAKSMHGFNFAAKHYDLPTLMTGKIHAILTRRNLKGKKNRESIKGRDYFDLLWFVKNGIKPNLKRLSDIMGKDMTLKHVEQQLDNKISEMVSKYENDFISDLIPLVSNPNIIEPYIKNYHDEYLRYKLKSFSTMVDLKIKCKKCKREFYPGISIEIENFKEMVLGESRHKCPYCGYINIVNKDDLFL